MRNAIAFTTNSGYCYRSVGTLVVLVGHALMLESFLQLKVQALTMAACKVALS